MEERGEEGRGSEPSVAANPTITPLADSGLERAEQLLAALKGAEESRKKKKRKQSFRTCKRMLKRLR